MRYRLGSKANQVIIEVDMLAERRMGTGKGDQSEELLCKFMMTDHKALLRGTKGLPGRIIILFLIA